MSLKFLSLLFLSNATAACAIEQHSVNPDIFDMPPGIQSHTFEVCPSTNFIALNIREYVIEYANDDDPDNRQFMDELSQSFNALRAGMMPVTVGAIHKTTTAKLFAVMLKLEDADEIQLSASNTIETICSSLESGGNISLTASTIKGDIAFLTAPGKVIFHAPEGSKSRLKSVELHASQAIDRPFTYCFQGIIDFATWPSQSSFGVFGAKSVTLNFDIPEE